MSDVTHSQPVFEGRWSHRHAPVPLTDLAAEADAILAREGPCVPESFVQFAGFPRSGHSLVGALIGAAPGAAVAHELDAMALVAAGFSGPRIAALARRNATAFAASGHWWNGYRYAVETAAERPAGPPRVVGDKKGDRALRLLARDAGLLARLRTAFPDSRRPWIVVLRNPFDNVATMSLRKGRHYDRLRIRGALENTPRDGESGVPTRVLPRMVADYEALCGTLGWLLGQLPPEEVVILRHEDLVAAPARELARLLDFLDLPAGEDFVSRAAGLVAGAPHLSRHELHWPAPLKERVAALIDRHAFLAGYGWRT